MTDASTLEQLREAQAQANALAQAFHQQAADDAAKANDRFRAHVARDLCQEAAQKLREAEDMVQTDQPKGEGK